ncbi:hypothetical protein [Siminovitchia terrae]|uniref:hypothetical protein n=1 Tax=Siminovitchia terrae TaxID=1914933 RepID=UPI001BB3F734|nr:hypothetical protein [Siminovitchia terrae]
MRPIEVLLSFANLLAFLALIVPWLHSVPWRGVVVLATLIIVIGQALIECWR